MKKTVALLAFVAGVLAGSASAAMTHTAATIDTRTDVLMDELPEGTPVTPMIDDDGQLVIVLSTNITGSLTIPADLGSVTLDLNGWSIKGTNGVDGTETTFGGDGGAAVIVKGASGADAGATRITVVDERSDRVQLWENGPYFASCNVGATKPEEYGYYFWWGDTVGYTNNGSAWISVVDGTTPISFAESSTPVNTTYNKSYSELKSMGYIDDEANPVLNAANDAARAYLKGDWRMPTSDEIRALVDNCTREWTTNGVCGYIVRGKDDYASKSIFLPAAGYGLNSTTTLLGSDGYYWSSTPTSDSLYSFDLYFHSGTFSRQNGGRWSGMPVRPVTSTGDGRPDPGPGPAEVVGGNGGNGDKTGGNGGEGGDGVGGDVETNDGDITGGDGGDGGDDVGGEGPTGGKGKTTDGANGEDGKATPQSLWIADHADAGEGYVNLAIQVNLPTGTTLTAELAEKYAANFKAVCAATEADFDKATPQPVTFVKLANGLIWVKVAVPAIDSRLLWKVACPKL